MVNENRVIFLVVAVASIGWAVATNYPPRAMSHEAVVRCGTSLDLINGFTRGRQGIVGSLRWAPLPTVLIIPLLAVPTLAQTGFAACVLGGLAGAVFAAFMNGWLTYCGVGRVFRYATVALLAANPLWLQEAATGRTALLFALLIVSACCFLIHWLQTLELRSLAYLSIICGLAVLTRYQAIIFVALVFAVVIAYLLVEREKETYTEGTLIVLLSPTAYAVVLWFGANWLIMGDALFFLRGTQVGEGAPRPAMLTDACEWSFCLLPLFAALGAWVLTQARPGLLLRLVRGVAIVALAATALVHEVRNPSPLLPETETTAAAELSTVVADIERDFAQDKVVVSGYNGYEVLRRVKTYGIFKHVMSVYLAKVLEETLGQKVFFLVSADEADGHWEDMNLTYPGIYQNGADFAIFERAWTHWRMFRIVRIDSPQRPQTGEGAEAGAASGP